MLDKLIAVTAMLGLLIGCGDTNTDEGGETASIYYIPIGAETYVAITMENIRDMSEVEIAVPTSQQTFQRLLKVIEGAKRSDTRLLADSAIFIDNEGSVLIDKTSRSLSPRGIDHTRTLIRSLLRTHRGRPQP